MEYLIAPLILVASIMTGIFVLASLRHDNSIADIWYGIVFAIVATITLLAGMPTIVKGIITALVIIWAVRLASRIYAKNAGKPEDFRYATWRNEWSTRGKVYFLIRSYLQVFLLQGAVIYVVSLPVIVVNASSASTLTLVSIFGVLVWIVGFCFESIADWQLDRFLANPANKGTIMNRGLFRFSRRPNYFGESLMWFGIAIIAFGVLPLPAGLMVFVSPLLITYILTRVTGPMLEAKWDTNPAYQEYKKQTNYFIPGFPKKRKMPE